MKITTDDLLAALSEAMAKPADGDASTTEEIAATTGRAIPSVRRALKIFALEGRLEVVTVLRPTLDGRTAPRPGYRIKPKSKK